MNSYWKCVAQARQHGTRSRSICKLHAQHNQTQQSEQLSLGMMHVRVTKADPHETEQDFGVKRLQLHSYV